MALWECYSSKHADVDENGLNGIYDGQSYDTVCDVCVTNILIRGEEVEYHVCWQPQQTHDAW